MTPALPAAWRIASAEFLADGIGGKVRRVEREDGNIAALKQASALALPELDNAVSFLRWINGDGAVRLLDRQGDLILLEWAGERRLLDHLAEHGDDDATEISADVVKRLHAPHGTPVPPALMTLEENFASLFARAEADRQEGVRSQFVEAAECADALLSNQRDVRPLHGDIHHENILLSQRDWLAIDPKGLVGDPAFDIANLFYNPVESELRTSETRAVSMATILSRSLGCDIVKVLNYAFAFSALSASWHAEDGNLDEAARSLAVGRTVRAALTQVRS